MPADRPRDVKPTALWWGARGRWLTLTFVLTSVWMLVLRLVQPHWWYADDMRNQYVPAFRDIGRRLLGGETPPAIDPNLGPSGNFSLDVQYGTYDPMHWLMSVVASRMPDLPTAGFAMAAIFTVILAVGGCALCLRLGSSGPWAVTAGFAIATSGYVAYWLAPTWIPGLVSIAWLPWLWWAVVGAPTRRRLLAVALFSYLIIAGGWPSTWLAFGALSIGVVVEALVSRTGRPGHAEWLKPLALRAGAALAGFLVGFVNVLPVMGASDFTARSDETSWDRFLVPHLLDTLNTVAVHASTPFDGFTGDVEDRPIFFFGWFVVTLLWCTRWRPGAFRLPGVMAGLVASLMMLALTQLPGTLGPLRSQVRQLAGFQVLALLTVVVIVAHLGLTWSRRRGIGIAVTTAALVLVVAVRDRDPSTTLPWTLVALLAVAVLAVAVRGWHGHAARTGAVALLGSVVVSTVAWALAPVNLVSTQGLSRLSATPLTTKAGEQPALALYPKTGNLMMEEWRRQGVATGFQRLTAGNRVMPGYSSVSSQAFRAHFNVHRSHGYTNQHTVEALFESEKSTGQRWFELLGLRTILVHRSMQEAFESQRNNPFRPAASSRDFVKYVRPRTGSWPGRVTYAPPRARIEAEQVSRGSQTYRVHYPRGGRVIFRDIYWPGYVATLDGEPLSVRGLKRLVVAVELPRRSHGQLELTWKPLGGAPLAATLGGGAVVLVVVLGLATLWRRDVRAGTRATPGAEAGRPAGPPGARE